MSRRVSEQQYSLHRPETPHYDLPGHAPEPSISIPELPAISSPTDQFNELSEHTDLPQPDHFLHPPEPSLGRSPSTTSTRLDASSIAAARNGTLRKKASTNRRIDLSRKSSRRSVPGLTAPAPEPAREVKLDEQYNNIFRVPIPTSGNPTDVLANRFQAWRRLLKDLITYFREIQTSYEQRSKALTRLYSSINNLTPAREFMSDGGLNDAIAILRSFTQVSVTEANKARAIEDDVITQLNSLRNDLNSKIKEIKSLSGDFKNSVDKEKEGTKRIVEQLRDALALSETNPAAASGKNDPFIIRLAVERQVEKQMDEENYLHKAYLNLEGSGRELEAIIVGEVQKAYNAYAGILRREGENAHHAAEQLRSGPIALPKDWEWENFVQGNPNFINPKLPLRKIENITYPGRYNPAAAEIRAGTLERKSKYLKSYTPGWYVLSATHIHEFKSADHLHTQAPVMSLFLLDQKLGVHSQQDQGSPKFSLKGRQSGGLVHRGHSWVFRAETYDTMMAWYEDIRNLIERTGEDKLAFVRKHARTASGPSTMAPSAIETEDAIPAGQDETMLTESAEPQEVAETMPQELDSFSGHGARDESFDRDSVQPEQGMRSTTSSVYGVPSSFPSEFRAGLATRSMDAMAQNHDRRVTSDSSAPGSVRQPSLAAMRTSVPIHHPPVPPLDARSSQSQVIDQHLRHDDSVDPLEQPASYAMRQYLNDTTPSTLPLPQKQMPRSSNIPTTPASTLALPHSSALHQATSRSSGEYSPTSTARNQRSFHDRTSALRPESLRVAPDAAHRPESAEYSPTSMPKMSLNFAGGPPNMHQGSAQPPPTLQHHDEAVDRMDHLYDAPPTRGPGPQNVPPSLLDSYTAMYGNGFLAQPHNQALRKSSSVYDGDTHHDNIGLPLSTSGIPPGATSAVLAATPPLDNDATTTTTTDDQERDRDELTVTTTTEPRTSVDTTIQMAESQELGNEKDDDLIDPEVSLLRNGKWDGTIPVVSEVYVPGNKYSHPKSAFSEHFGD